LLSDVKQKTTEYIQLFFYSKFSCRYKNEHACKIDWSA